MAEKVPDTGRLEAFSDGVIAVIITVMVLEIKVPHADGFRGLLDLLPALLVYLLSFVFSGTYWLNHQALLRRADRAGHAMQCANLGFLFCLSLLPLSTAYVVDKRLSGFAVAVYAAQLLACALSFLWLRLTVLAHLRRREATVEEDHKGLRNHLLSMAIYAACIPAATFFPRGALGVLAGLTLFWIIPDLSLRKAQAECT